jgi:hypothetical protein
MKTVNVLVLASIISVLLLVSPISSKGEPVVGVKEGDWIEYDVSITGIGSPPPTHDVNWLRIEFLPIQGTAFSANFTVRYTNGTIGTAIWKFNLTEGELEGWIVIPSNLSPGDTFYDLSRHTRKPVYVMVRGQEQRTVLGATRTVTYGNDSLRHKKEWDKETGMFIGSTERLKNVTNKAGWYIEDLTVKTKAIATNMWGPDSIGTDQEGVYPLVGMVAFLAMLTAASVAVVTRKKETNVFSFGASTQAKIAVLTVIGIALIEVATILFFPFYDVGISFAEFNLVMQTIWTALVLISMWFRTKNNYFAHEITMLIVMSAWAVGFASVLFIDPLSGSTEIFSSTTLRLIMNALHGVFSVPALFFGLWLVLLWRPASTTFAAKSKKIAQLTALFWVPSYVVGVLDFLLLHTRVFG